MKTIISFLFILSICLYFNCSDNKPTDKAKDITRDGANINYQISGNGDTTLLFVHGAYIDQTYWKDQVNYFSPHFKVVTIDLPGHGLSGKTRQKWSIQGFAGDIITVIKELNLKNVILIGHSMSGDINLIAATSYPEPIIGFIGIDNFKHAVYQSSPEDLKQVDTMLIHLKQDFAKSNEQFARMYLLTSKTPEAITNRVVTDFKNANQVMELQIMPEIFDTYKLEKELLPKMKWKLNLINVDYKPLDETPLKQYPGAGYQVYHINGTSHYPMLETPDALNKAIDQVIHGIK